MVIRGIEQRNRAVADIGFILQIGRDLGLRQDRNQRYD
jgi:hypothetical protein